MKKKTIHNFIRPQNYYNHLLSFFFILSFILTLSLNLRVGYEGFEVFLLQFFIILVLFAVIAVVVEYFYAGDYIAPLEIYDVQHFVLHFLDDLYEGKKLGRYFNFYDHKTHKKQKVRFSEKRKYVISSIRKVGKTYHVTLFDEHKVFRFFIIRFLLGKVIYKLYIRKVHNKYKIIKIS